MATKAGLERQVTLHLETIARLCHSLKEAERAVSLQSAELSGLRTALEDALRSVQKREITSVKNDLKPVNFSIARRFEKTA